ncbi:MAG TPA: response regulator [Pyrinomonadaceae bacterium]|nr:response regulator [Pyrinomonadaceae bacterium]
MSSITKERNEVLVSLEVVWQGTAGKHDARMGEIGMNGCFIDSMGQEVLGETIHFKVHLPSGHWVSLQGKVVYQEYPIGFGLDFTNLTDGDKRILEQVIAAHGGKPLENIAEEVKSAPLPTPEISRRVLVAEDDPMTLRMLTAIIETQDYKVVAVEDGREAFRILQFDADFSAAVFDMMMPHLHGIDLIHYMKTDARLKHIPVGMITAEQDPKIWDDSIAAGASVFLPKPFSPPQVQMMLRMLASKTGT